MSQDLRKAGLKVTHPRLRILELLEHAKPRHMTAEDIYKQLLAEGEEIGLATIYRVLGQFEQAGLLRRNSFAADKAIYELNEGMHHDHLICLDCGRVEEFFSADIEKLQQNVARDKGYTLGEHSLSLYAHCNKVRCEGKKGKDEGAKNKNNKE